MNNAGWLHRMAGRRSAIALATLTWPSVLAAPVAAIPPGSTDPSTTTAPYVIPVADDVRIASILTVNDAGAAGNGYEMVGIPDGLGATRVDDDRFILYMNHELRTENGITRRHGQRGAFTSRLVISTDSLRVRAGSDFVDPRVQNFDYPSGRYVTAGARFADGTAQGAAFARWCSATLSDPGLFLNERSGRGYAGQVWFGNEESGDVGRSYGATADGAAMAVPRLGLFSWENTVPAPNKSDVTLVMGQEDGPNDGSQLWAYIGSKVSTGHPLARAGLTNGRNFVIDAANAAVTNDVTWRATYGKGVGARVTLNEVGWNQSGAAQNAEASTDGLSLNRVEDGHWDPNRPNDFYFVTTEGGQVEGSGVDARDGGGLWRLRFRNIENPRAGATLTLLLDGSESLPGDEPKLNKPDNITIDRHGNLLIQEDPGNNNHLARIVAYRINGGALGVVARADPSLFSGPTAWTVDEESSGIIDTEALLGPGTFLFDAQIHTAAGLPPGTGRGTVEEYVENGQLMVMRVADWSSVYAD